MNQIDIMSQMLSNLSELSDYNMSALCRVFRSNRDADSQRLCQGIPCDKCPFYSKSTVRDFSVKLKEIAKLSTIVEG